MSFPVVRVLSSTQPWLRLSLTPNQTAATTIPIPAFSAWSGVTHAVLFGSVCVFPPLPHELLPLQLEVSWSVGGATEWVLLDEEMLVGGGARWQIEATEPMVSALRNSAPTALTLQVKATPASGTAPISVSLFDVALVLSLQESAEWSIPSRDVARMEPCVLRCRYQGERFAEPFVLFQESYVRSAHGLRYQQLLLERMAASVLGGASLWYRRWSGLMESLFVYQKTVR